MTTFSIWVLSKQLSKTVCMQRLLNYIEPDHVHVMEAGRIIYSGGKEVAGVLETDGYEGVRQLLQDKEPVAA